MCDQTEIEYLDGEVVWVHLNGSCWWPGEVVGPDKLPPDVMPSFRKPPIAVVKFFQEDTFEYVKNLNGIYKYNCSRKNEFINKGLYLYRTKHGHMEKFPEDVVRAEAAVGGDIDILNRDEFQEEKKESYKGIFGDQPKKTPTGRQGRGRPPKESPSVSTPIRKFKEKTDYKVHILLQGSKDQPKEPVSQSTDAASTPSTSRAGSEVAEDKPQKVDPPSSNLSTPVTSSAGTYACHSCQFTTSRLNVLILHNKTHSSTFTPYTPSPVRKKPAAKPTPKSTPKTSKPPKTPRPRKEKLEKTPKKSSKGKKRAREDQSHAEVKKPKTEQEIKSSLLADWDDDADDESNDESVGLLVSRSPQVPAGSESPAVPTPAELPVPQLAREPSSPFEKKEEAAAEKPECSSDSKYEFCEDEDWHVEADAGRKIPRVKNPSKRKEDTKSLSLDDEEMAKEVAELLNKTAVPELPSVPEPLKVEENFPEPSIVKSPDKKSDNIAESNKSENTGSESKPTKAIFKTKTFFRSRHSRSQDAIGKYVAEQLNPERLDMLDSEINGAEAVSSPEARESPPVDHVKVARLAPKMQLKKIKAQLLEKEKNVTGWMETVEGTKSEKTNTTEFQLDTKEIILPQKTSQDVIYPTQEIKPINKDEKDKILYKESNNIEIDKTDKTYKESSQQSNKSDKASDMVHETCYENMDYTKSAQREPSPFIECPKKADEELYMAKSKSYVPDNEKDMEFSEDKNKEATNHKEDFNSELGAQILHDHPIKASPKKVSLEERGNLSNLGTIEDVCEPSPPKQPRKSDIPHVSPGKSSPQKAYQQLIEPYMNESTASAVDALLSVSREADRVPRVIGSGPPEDLFEDDKEVSTDNVDVVVKDNGICEDHEINNGKTEELVQDLNGFTNKEFINEIVTQHVESEMPSTVPQDIESETIEGSIVTEHIESEIPPTVNQDVESQLPSIDTRRAESETSPIVTQHIESDKSFVVTQDVESELPSIVTQQIESEISSNHHVEILSSKDNEMIVDKEENAVEGLPTESDLQIAETLLNLPSTALQSKAPDVQENVDVQMCTDDQQFEEEISETIIETVVENDVKSYGAEEIVVNDINSDMILENNKNMNIRFETEQEKSENLNAAQSLVQMSECVEHKMNMVENAVVNDNDMPNAILNAKQNNGIEPPSLERKMEAMSSENNNDLLSNIKSTKPDNTSSRLLKILEDTTSPKPPVTRTTPTKQSAPLRQVLVSGKEKILNFDVAKASVKSKSPAPKQKIIIRRTGAGKSFINNLSDVVASPDKIILSRSNVSAQDGSSVQTFTIQGPEITTSSETKQIIIQPKIRKINQPKTVTKLQKIKPQNSLVHWNEAKTTTSKTSVAEEPMFDINSMPVVLSDDILTPESIEKMPIVMSDGNIISNAQNPPKLIKTAKPTILENEKISISPSPSKPESKSLIMTTATSSDANKGTTPNILSKSAKLRGAKPMLVIDKTTGKQKIIMTKAEPTVVKEPKPAQTIIQSVPQPATKTEKFIILPTGGSPRPTRAQKIVIDPQTGKAHVLVAKGQEAPLSAPVADNKPVSAKLIPSSSDSSSPGNTVMIITNAQGTQSRIVLTHEHEKILFGNKQQPNMSQLKAITQKITTNATAPKTIVNTASPVKQPAKIVPKQKSAIITSKGQLIVGGRVATTAQNIAPMPEIRPAPKPAPKSEMRSIPKKIVAAEPKKLIQTIQKNTSEPLIFLQQKSGAVMQLTAAQFEHLQRTGQIVQKATAPAPAPVQEKIIVQKTITVPPKEIQERPVVQKQRIRKSATASPSPAKRVKQEIAIAPAPVPVPQMPPLTSLSNNIQSHALSSIVPSASNTVSVTTSSYPDLNNFEDLLPTSAIARPSILEQPAVVPQVQPEPPPEPADPPPAQLSDGQLLAVPGENFGGPPGSFYLCVEDNGTLTPIDNRPLVLENNQLVPMAIETMPVFAPQPERRDILEAALANSDVFHAEATRDEAPDFRDLNANVSVHCRVSETSTTLNQPIMTPVEVPTKGESEPTVPSNLEEGLAVIGVTPHTVPTTLELPITVTDPRIAPKTTDPLSSSNYGTALLTSPNTDMSFVTAEETEVVGGPISMPLLTDDESVGKSMPILTDEVAERTVSSVESAGSPSSIDVREGEAEEGGGWARRLLTPGTDGSDASETSAEIPLQPALQISGENLLRDS